MKITVKTFIMLQKVSISYKFCFYSSKNVSQFLQKYQAAIRSNSWAAIQHITMISEGSCDTEDWSNDAENTAFTSQE